MEFLSFHIVKHFLFDEDGNYYSDNQKTLEQDDFLAQVIALNSPMNMRHSKCAV